MINVYASQPNFWRHLAPIVDELGARGHDIATWADRAYQPWGDRFRAQSFPDGEVVIVASWIDARRAVTSPVVYVEHGAGQTYRDGRGDSYAGAQRLDHVVAFIGPGDHVADRWRAVYPRAVVASVGCPALDQHLAVDQIEREAYRDTANVGRPVVAISSHWRCTVVPETQQATPLFFEGLRELAALNRFAVVGHSHPRQVDTMQAMWARLRIPFEPDPDVILRCADLVVVDNSSLAYEAAALDIPVLSLNAPAYRRDVEHGLRFWSHVPGLQCDRARDLVELVDAALDDPPDARDLHFRAAAHVYAHRDAHAARRAVDVIESVL